MREGQRVVRRDGILATAEDCHDGSFRLKGDDGETWWVSPRTGMEWGDDGSERYERVFDAVADAALTYPFKEGQRVVMRNGQIVTIKRVKTNGLVDTSAGTSTVYDTTDFGHGRGFSTEQESDYDFMRDALDDEED